MVYLAKNNLESRAMHQQSEELSIHSSYFPLANTVIPAQAIFALKDQRKKQRIFHNKQILTSEDNVKNKLLFCHFSKNTQSAPSFHIARAALIQALLSIIAQNQCMAMGIQLVYKYLRLNKPCKNFLYLQTYTSLLIKSSLAFGKVESVISSIQKALRKRGIMVIISAKWGIIFEVVLVQAKILSFLLTQLTSSQIIA